MLPVLILRYWTVYAPHFVSLLAGSAVHALHGCMSAFECTWGRRGAAEPTRCGEVRTLRIALELQSLILISGARRCEFRRQSKWSAATCSADAADCQHAIAAGMRDAVGVSSFPAVCCGHDAGI